MENKEVEVKISELRAAILLMHKELKKDMAAEFKEQLKEVKESLQNDILLMEKRLAAICLKRKEDCIEGANAEDDDLTLSSDSSETEYETDQMLKKLSRHQTDYFLKLSFDAYSGSDSSDSENWDEQAAYTPSGVQDCSQQAASEIHKNSCSYLDSVENETSSLMKKSKEEKSKRSPSSGIFMASIQKSWRAGVDAKDVEDTNPFLMERQWTTWMDQQEKKGSLRKEKITQERDTQSWKASAANELRKQRSAAGQERSMKKIRRKLSHFFDFQTSHKWQKLQED
ncbi:uncharacterized protein LOC112148314 [Oryzias melastigma]|uniref:uncharacterized protein LOC112148314 n=1 Tax=Oryzias melastigma TaxID=30732 RepID=UPI000CF8078B|nr:uncharacterized protein LOC112148314 [Oryzias melastigma]